MLRTNSLQGNAGLATVHCCDKAPLLMFLLQFLTATLKVGIEIRKFLPEVLNRALEVIVRNKEVLLNISLLNTIASLTSEDNEFADNISATEVDTWVWLRISLLLGTANGL